MQLESVSFPTNTPVMQQSAPTTGQTVTINNGTDIFLVEPAGTLATLTINLPTPQKDGHLVAISSSQIVTALTLSSGLSIIAALAAFAVGSAVRYVYKLSDNSWHRCA